jgi:hypothetical protein
MFASALPLRRADTTMDPPLIGSKISLISKNEIRYEGILWEINKVDTTIALKNGERQLVSVSGVGRGLMEWAVAKGIMHQRLFYYYLVLPLCGFKTSLAPQ